MFGKLILIISICLAGGHTHREKVSIGEYSDVVIATSTICRLVLLHHRGSL